MTSKTEHTKPDGEDQLVRDACTIGYYGPKREYRRRLRAYVAREREAAAEEAITNYIRHLGTMLNRDGWIESEIEHELARLKQS